MSVIVLTILAAIMFWLGWWLGKASLVREDVKAPSCDEEVVYLAEDSNGKPVAKRRRRRWTED